MGRGRWQGWTGRWARRAGGQTGKAGRRANWQGGQAGKRAKGQREFASGGPCLLREQILRCAQNDRWGAQGDRWALRVTGGDGFPLGVGNDGDGGAVGFTPISIFPHRGGKRFGSGMTVTGDVHRRRFLLTCQQLTHGVLNGFALLGRPKPCAEYPSDDGDAHIATLLPEHGKPQGGTNRYRPARLGHISM